MGAIATQITSLTIVYSNVYSDANQRKHQSSASRALVWGVHRGPVNSPHKWPVTRKMLPIDDVIMEETIKERCKIGQHLTTTQHNKTRTVEIVHTKLLHNSPGVNCNVHLFRLDKAVHQTFIMRMGKSRNTASAFRRNVNTRGPITKIRKIVGCTCSGNAGMGFPATDCNRNP